MANLSPVVLIIIWVVCVVIALVIGYFIGRRSGSGHKEAVKQEKQKHDELKADVREHFQQTSAIMSRMVDDYREMYQHMSEGADKLGGLSNEKKVAPPPSPEAITRDRDQGEEKKTPDEKTPAPATAGEPSSEPKRAADHRTDAAEQTDSASRTQPETSKNDTPSPSKSNAAHDTNTARADTNTGTPSHANPNAGKAASVKSGTSRTAGQSQKASETGSDKAPAGATDVKVTGGKSSEAETRQPSEASRSRDKESTGENQSSADEQSKSTRQSPQNTTTKAGPTTAEAKKAGSGAKK